MVSRPYRCWCTFKNSIIITVKGIGTLAEQYILRKLHAVEHDHDTEEEASKKKAKTIFLRTLTACDGFTIALLNIFLGVFVDSF